jgi:hypothetical protein
MRMEIGNGEANRRLADGEWRVMLTSTKGKEMPTGKNLWPLSPFIGEGEIERGEHGPARWCWMADGLPIRWEHSTTPAPLLQVRLMRGAVSLKPTQATVPPGRAQIFKPKTFLFSKLTQICKL